MPCSVTSISVPVIIIGINFSFIIFALFDRISLSGYPTNSIFNKNVALRYPLQPAAWAATCSASIRPLILNGSYTSNNTLVPNAGPLCSVGAMMVSTSTLSIHRSNAPGLSLLNAVTSCLTSTSLLVPDESMALTPLPFVEAITYFNGCFLHSCSGSFIMLGDKAARIKL